jgi:tetratricopeptide (TPR) repeat protein
MKFHFHTRGLAAFAAILCASAAFAAPVDDAVADLQHDWETIKYKVPAKEQEARFEALAAKAHKVAVAFPDRAEPLIWEGIVVSSLAGAKGGLGALGLAKQAKGLYEGALKLQPDALEGSAYNSLGVLYYKVPGWPVGFGDKAKAQEHLRRVIELTPGSENSVKADELLKAMR